MPRLREALALAAVILIGPTRLTPGQEGFATELHALLAIARIPAARWPDIAPEIDDLNRYYATRHNAPAWLAPGGATPAARDAIATLAGAGADGLDPADYDAATLDSTARVLAGTTDARDQAEFDLLLSVDFLRYCMDLAFGRANPGLTSRSLPTATFDAVSLLTRAAADSTSVIVASLRPQLSQYRLLQRALVRYRTDSADNPAATSRIRQLELALERLRWLPPLGHGPLVVVNVPAFQLFALDSAGSGAAPALSMKVIVGKAMRTRTPVLVEQMRYLEFHPYWYVPYRVAIDEILPEIRRHPRYLTDNDMELVIGGRVLGDSLTAALRRRLISGEVQLRQRPTPKNALGPIKFVFPNDADIYLHGTPETSLFARTRRDFSHGCIRVEHPAALAAWALRDEPAWPIDSIRAAIAAPDTRRVFFSRPIPVVVFYATAVATQGDSVTFYRDLYGYDQRLDQTLRAGPGGN